MCMLTHYPAGVAVDEMGLLNGGLWNEDGHGWAVVAGDRIIVGKSMDIQEAIDQFSIIRDKHLDQPAMFHSRYATHGAVNMDNVHPFKVGGSELTYMAHNGILPCTPKKGDPRSDTRVLADDLLPTRFKRLDKKSANDALHGYIGKGNKLCILTVDKRYRHNAYLINEAAGNWEHGIWYSNYDWTKAPSYGKGATMSYGYEDWPTTIGVLNSDWLPTTVTSRKFQSQAVDCYMCGQYAISLTGYCHACGCCQDCLEDVRDCLCFTRSAGRE